MLKKVVVLIVLSAAFLGYPMMGSAYEVVDVSNGGSVTGTVKVSGTPPVVEKLAVTKNADFCGAETLDPRYVIGSGGTVKNAIVTIEIDKGKKAVPVQGAKLDNVKCVYEPHVQAITAGTTMIVVNSDPIMHNSHSYFGKKTVFNLALPIKDQKVKKRMRRPGLITAKCDAGHKWMTAYVYVSKHPYYAVTDGGGTFSISDIPPGTYKIKVWHEAFGVMDQEVTVTAGGKTSADFNYPGK